MPTTPGEVELPGVVKEASEVETAVASVFSSNTLIHSNAETVLVLEHSLKVR
jgi:hypothetical protein